MKSVWIAYTDGYKRCYESYHNVSAYDSDAIEIGGIFDTELACRRFCMENDINYKCKEFEVQEDKTSESPLHWEPGVKEINDYFPIKPNDFPYRNIVTCKGE